MIMQPTDGGGHGGGNRNKKPRLVIFHRNMGFMGGAQRDLIVALPEHGNAGLLQSQP